MTTIIMHRRTERIRTADGDAQLHTWLLW